MRRECLWCDTAVWVTTQPPKNASTIVWSGRGSQTRRKQQGHIITTSLGAMAIVDHAKYLGYWNSASGSNLAELQYRLQQTQQALQRTCNLWRTAAVTDKTRKLFYLSLVRSVFLYTAEIKIWAKQDQTALERFQTRALRRIFRSPAHITKESGDELRLRVGRNSINPVIFETSQAEAVPGNPKSETLGAVKVAFLGLMFGETQFPQETNTPFLKTIGQDIRALAGHFATAQDIQNQQAGHAMWEWFSEVPDTKLDRVLIYQAQNGSVQEKLRDLPTDPLLACPECSTHLLHMRKSHRFSAHKVRNALRHS